MSNKLRIGILFLAFGFILGDTFKIKNIDQQRGENSAFLSDENLLIKRASAIGIIENDRTIRKALSRAALEKLSKIETNPTEQTLQAFYHSHTSLFEREAKIHLQQFYFAKTKDSDLNNQDIKTKYHNALKALKQNRAVDKLDLAPIILPEKMLPISLVYRSLGPSITPQLLKLRASEASPLIEDTSGHYFFYCKARVPAKVMSYDESKALVKIEYRRRTKDKRLRTALTKLWSDAKIIIPENTPLL